MPYPAQINAAVIVQTAREMIEAEGVDHLSLHKIAAALGVKTPSLYRYVENKTALLRAVNEETYRQLFEAITPALEADSPTELRLLNIARAYREFAHGCPITYGLAFTNTIAELQPDDQQQVQAVLPFQALMADLSGEADSLAATRGFLALMHGFVMLELANQLRRGGDLGADYAQSIAAYIAGWRHG